MKKPKKDVFKKICEAKGGNISEIAKGLGVTRKSVYKWVETDAKFKDILEDVKETFLDLCETQLQTLVKGIPAVDTDERGNKVLTGWKERPSEAAIFFTLKTRGKSRGYIERHDITTNDESLNKGFLDFMMASSIIPTDESEKGK